MIILGISAYYHDSSAALIIDGKIVCGALEERFSLQKHDNRFPSMACEFCLKFAKLLPTDVDEIVFYEKPIIKFERILRSHILYAPRTFGMFLKSIPIWLKERLNMRRTINKEWYKNFGCHIKNISFVDHHLSHAANAFFQSGLEESSIIVVDAVGENKTTSIYKASQKKIELLESQHYPNSLGLLYSAATYYLGFKVNSDEYKVMGLAPYGDPKSEETNKFINIICNQLIELLEEGGIILNDKYFSFTYGNKMLNEERWQALFGISIRKPEDEILQSHKNLAYAFQFVYEKALLGLAKKAKRLTNSTNLCLSGGCALNCAANRILAESNIFNNIYIPYAPDDSGCSIGAALAVSHIKYNIDIVNNNSTFLGPEYSNQEIHEILVRSKINYRYLENKEIYDYVAKQLSSQKIIAWFQGKMEFGPRALGNRSILADPRCIQIKDIINSKVKYRESFRPFAPVVIKEFAEDLFSVYSMSGKHMSFTYKVKSCKYPGITHVDNTARVQILDYQDNPLLYNLLREYYHLTGSPLLLNTSFNVMGDPIVCNPQDAINTFKKSGIDILVVGNFILEKSDLCS